MLRARARRPAGARHVESPTPAFLATLARTFASCRLDYPTWRIPSTSTPCCSRAGPRQFRRIVTATCSANRYGLGGSPGRVGSLVRKSTPECLLSRAGTVPIRSTRDAVRTLWGYRPHRGPDARASGPREARPQRAVTLRRERLCRDVGAPFRPRSRRRRVRALQPESDIRPFGENAPSKIDWSLWERDSSFVLQSSSLLLALSAARSTAARVARLLAADDAKEADEPHSFSKLRQADKGKEADWVFPRGGPEFQTVRSRIRRERRGSSRRRR